MKSGKKHSPEQNSVVQSAPFRVPASLEDAYDSAGIFGGKVSVHGTRDEALDQMSDALHVELDATEIKSQRSV